MIRIPLDGETNFRDLGGYVGHGGRPVRTGFLFRSGHLSHLSDADLVRLRGLGIRRVVDLRTDVERKAKPNKLPKEIEEWHLPLLADLGATSLDALFLEILEGSINAESYMCDIYRKFDSAKMDSWRKFFKLLELGEPILWHCTAGKDRTGMTSAIVLHALGVDQDAIQRDYLLTNECSYQTVQQTISMFQEKFGDAMAMKLKDLVIAKALYLDTYMQAIQEQFGGWDGLLGELGVHKERLRELYLDSISP